MAAVGAAVRNAQDLWRNIVFLLVPFFKADLLIDADWRPARLVPVT
jgi:hypothetical protein